MNVCDDMIKLPLPRYLQEHKTEILHIFDNATGWDYNPEGWQSNFADDPIVSGDLSRIIGKCPDKICRADVRYFARQARYGDYPELKRLFLACMIWGYGADPNGLSNVKLAFSDSGRLREVLEKSVGRIKSAQIKEAYEEFDLKGCKSPFFTKFFYFVGQGWEVKPPLPLILDKHVRNFLEFLSKDEQKGWHISIFEGAKGYIQYACSMNDWAQQLNCPADNIEYFMYLKDKEKYRSKRHLQGVEMSGTWQGFTAKQAEVFSRKSGYTDEVNIIEKMEKPVDWAKSPFSYAKRGNYVLMWQWKGEKNYPMGRKPSENWLIHRIERFWEYIEKTSEGKDWRRKYGPKWLGDEATATSETGTTESVQIALSTERMNQLRRLAGELDVDIVTLVKMWVLEHLRQ